jgi:uncharacterized membrane protein
MVLYRFLLAFILFGVLDVCFLRGFGFIFLKQAMDIQGAPVSMNYMGALGAYLVLFFALYWFILSRGASVLDAAILGGVINGTFELTNMALFKLWRWQTILLDTFWGAFLWGFVTFVYRRVFL